MNDALLAILAGIAVYVSALYFLPRFLRDNAKAYKQHALARITAETQIGQQRAAQPKAATLKGGGTLPLVKFFFSVPGFRSMPEKLARAGLSEKSSQFVIGVIILLICMMLFFKRAGIFGLPLAIIITYLLANVYVRGKIRKRREAFINLFPDALDMVVRSIRSGYPLNTALRIIAENMLPPVSTEFKQVEDEVAYGRPLIDALERMGQRMEISDLRFFIVVLSVQQETGGNLAEVLANLASLMRKRKQLRLKIRALSAEGRTTAWIIGSLPFFIFLVLYFLAPQHLAPLFTTQVGNMLLIGALCSVGFGALIIRQMINMRI